MKRGTKTRRANDSFSLSFPFFPSHSLLLVGVPYPPAPHRTLPHPHMIFEIFKAAVHSVGTAATMTAAGTDQILVVFSFVPPADSYVSHIACSMHTGVYLHRRGMITPETKTGMARYTQQIAIPSLFFTIAIDCPQDHSSSECPNIMDHLRDAWVLLVWPIYVLLVGCLVGYLIIQIVQPPAWQRNCVLASTAFANAMGK